MKQLHILAIFTVMLGSWNLETSAQNVNVPDANLAAAIRARLNLAADADIPQTRLQELRLLFANNKGITDLTGLEHATGLTNLQLRGNPIKDFTPISSLINLRGLNLIGTGFSNSDLSILDSLTELRSLLLEYNSISSLTNFPQLPNLNTLHLGYNQISNISRLTDILDPTKVTEFSFTSNKISDLTPLSGFTNLTSLYLSINRIRDVTPLSGLTKLRSALRLGHNQISNISPLETLTELEDLFFHNNRVRDLSPLEKLTKLKRLVICNNPYTDINPIASLGNLQTLYIDMLFYQENKALVEGTTNAPNILLCRPQPEPEPKVKPRKVITQCGLGWAPQSQYQHWGELPKVMIYALEFEYDPESYAKYICKTIEIRTGDDSIENLGGWKLYLGTLYNPSSIPVTIPEEHSHVTDRILRITPEMLRLETFPCSTVNGISHPLPGVHYSLQTDENISVDTAYSCFIWGQNAYTMVNGENVESPRRVSSAALREMETPRLERYILDDTAVYTTYMRLDEFAWDRVVFSDWLLAPSESSAPGAPSAIQRKLVTTWGTLKK